MQDISGFGLRVRLVASATFPAGITITQFADDADPLDLAAIEVAATGMGVNGDLLVWSRANAIPAVLNVIPNSDNDRDLGILLEANRPGRGKNPARDVVTMTIIYPDGRSTTLSPGAITNGMSGNSVASAGRLKTKPYTFAFENKSSS
jgi:hypothetical protein